VPQDPIELRVDTVAQLFHSLDPYPFRERDLDKDAEDYIVGWARELDPDRPIGIVIYIPEAQAQSKDASELPLAFANYFTYRAASADRELKELFRVGRRSLAMGMAILAACLLSAHFLAKRFFDEPIETLVEESLILLGWVANWRPIEIFIYDWLPIVRRRNLYRRLAAAAVTIRPYPAGQAPKIAAPPV
ncbi:MAG TPA: hypothetical protein VNJ31_11770, partial [Methyloceanibacter sp.]|nr:hypothetical protein [Methyloceanibacter sp.]